MTVVAIPADPPRKGLVLSTLVESGPLSSNEATDLYAAALKDVVGAVAASGGELLVNYRPDELLPDRHVDPERSAEEAVRSVVADAVDPGTIRFERQVGSTPSARVGNTVTHLLREEGATTAAIARPTTPLMDKTHVDESAMKLRRSGVVLGPGAGQEVYYAGFAEPVDFEGALSVPELETLTARGRDADQDVDYLEAVPTVETPPGLLATVVQVKARKRAGRPVPTHTTAVVEEQGLSVVDRDGTPALVR